MYPVSIRRYSATSYPPCSSMAMIYRITQHQWKASHRLVLENSFCIVLLRALLPLFLANICSWWQPTSVPRAFCIFANVLADTVMLSAKTKSIWIHSIHIFLSYHLLLARRSWAIYLCSNTAGAVAFTLNRHKSSVNLALCSLKINAHCLCGTPCFNVLHLVMNVTNCSGSCTCFKLTSLKNYGCPHFFLHLGGFEQIYSFDATFMCKLWKTKDVEHFLIKYVFPLRKNFAWSVSCFAIWIACIIFNKRGEGRQCSKLHVDIPLLRIARKCSTRAFQRVLFQLCHSEKSDTSWLCSSKLCQDGR